MAGEALLIVDDNELSLRLVRALLIRAGYDVRTAGDAPAALSILEAFRPRLILMDLQLPGMDGLELTRTIKTRPEHGQTKIVALTAYSTDGADKALQAGCDGYVSKPIDARALPAMVQTYIHGTA